MSYSIIGIVAIVIHITINKNNIKQVWKKDSDRLEKAYGYFMIGILIYYLTDALWGVLDAANMTGLLYADTVVYYVAMSLAVVLWSEYVVLYLDQNNAYGNILRVAGRCFMMFEILALIINMHFPIFFSFDAQGNYEAGIIRYVALYIQIGLFLCTSVQTFYVARKLTGSIRRRYMTICILGIAMTIAIVAQIEYPLLPIYSIGYLLGSCVLHIYVEEDEKEEQFAILNHHMNIVSSMSNMFFCNYYIDLSNNTFIELGNRLEEVAFVIGKGGDAEEKFNQMSKYLVLPQYSTEMKEFCDVNTLDVRMRDKNYISVQFEGVHTGWAEGCFIAGDRDEEGHLMHVTWAIRTIKDEKEKEDVLRYNSYVDELTGLYNRKMYAEDIEDIESNPRSEQFALISMDVNGLKVINDSVGHAAGDELIKGAAECMKEVFEAYGRVYRTGGDEFIAIIYAPKHMIQKAMQTFEQKTFEFKGKYVEQISVSCGIVYGVDAMDKSIDEIEKIADANMYVAKQNYYQAKGIDKRGQMNAYNALCALYTKILKINLDDDSYSIILMNTDERTTDRGFAEVSISKWLSDFGKAGQVHPDDLDEYMSKTSREYLSDYFAHDKSSIDIQYRRKIGDVYKQVVMEMVPAEDYSDESRNLYLYVKAIDK